MDPKLSTAEIICNRCGSAPEIAITDSGSLYKGVRCNECGRIECLNCKGIPPDKPCYWCGGKVSPIGYIDRPISDGKKPYKGEMPSNIDNTYTYRYKGLTIILQILKPQKIYEPSDTIPITVEIISEKQTNTEDIEVRLIWSENYLYVPIRLGTSLFGYQPRKEKSIKVLSKKILISKGVIPANFRKVYEIDLPIPDDVQPTYNGKNTNVSLEVVVVPASTIQNNNLNLVVPLSGKFVKAVEPKENNKNLEVQLRLPRLEWAEGEIIRGQLLVRPIISNLGPVSADVTLLWEERIPEKSGLTSLTETREDVNHIKLADNSVVPPFEVTVYDFEMRIPVQNRPSLNTDNTHVRWKIIASAGKGMFKPTIRQPIYVYTSLSSSKPKTEPIHNNVGSAIAEPSSSQAIQSLQNNTDVDSGAHEQKRMALFRLRELHSKIAKDKSNANAFLAPLIFGGIVGVFIFFILSIPLVFIVQAFNGTSEPSPIPGCTGMVLSIFAWAWATSRFRRNAKQKFADLVTKDEAALKAAVDEIAVQFPDWVAEIGGTTPLLDSKTVDSLLKIK